MFDIKQNTFFRLVSMNINAYAMEASFVPQGKKPLIFCVHGFWNNRGVWAGFSEYAKKRGYGFHSVNLAPPWADMDYFACLVKNDFSKALELSGGNGVIMVGHSMGGLVIRRAMDMLSWERVTGYISVATPHGGTPLAWVGPGFASGGMLPASKWRDSLEHPLAPSLCIQAKKDKLVLPLESALPEWADNKLALDFGHNSILLTEVLWAEILKFADKCSQP